MISMLLLDIVNLFKINEIGEMAIENAAYKLINNKEYSLVISFIVINNIIMHIIYVLLRDLPFVLPCQR